MQRITWYAVVALAALVVPMGGQAQTPQSQMPFASVRELATIEGDTSGFVCLPGCQTLIIGIKAESTGPNQPRVDGSMFAYDVATKRRTLLGTNMRPAGVSLQGDRLAFTRPSQDATGFFLWTMPIDPDTGLATGQPQRVSLRSMQRNRASFSPDGQMIAYKTGPLSDGGWAVTLVPATGGAEHVVQSHKGNSLGIGWSSDGKFLYLERGDDSPLFSIERVSVADGRSEPLVPRTPITNRMALGVSNDLRVTFFQDNPNRFFFRTAAGVEGQISVPLPGLDDGWDGWGYNLTLDSSLRYITMTFMQKNGRTTSTIHEIDFRPALQAIAKR